ncbi:MAG: lipoyl domain-containing protein [Rhodobacteraceae bacterium]|jgi:pyruvate/2-oxoglutarate dehydrogenase complex dihydrolipoamide acyltransferase (E2) component|nr:lipoyl domain-containing protein [Paracoccaceae bacterium]
MRIRVKVPRLGLTIEEVTLASWERRAGATVAEGETIAVIEADKASYDLVAPAAGTLVETTCAQGDVVPVGETVAIIAT